MNSELLALYQADRQARVGQPQRGTPEYQAMRERDHQRCERVMDIVATTTLAAPEDWYHAAWIMNHGDTPAEAWNAHTFAIRSAELGYRPARWLAAATFDRWLMYQSKPQKYGTQYVSDGKRQRLWDVEPATTDAERVEWDVPPLAEQLRKAEEASRYPQLPIGDDAPQWLKDALIRWGVTDGESPEKD